MSYVLVYAARKNGEPIHAVYADRKEAVAQAKHHEALTDGLVVLEVRDDAGRVVWRTDREA